MDPRTGVWITDLIRYHVLIRVFDGDVDAWLALAETRHDGDIEFLQWLRTRLRQDNSLLAEIHEAVDRSGLWPAPEQK